MNVFEDHGVTIDIPSEFICPITLQLMNDPLISRFGRNYDSHAILSWIAKHRSCPITRQPLSPSNLIRDRILQSKILMWRSFNGLDSTDNETSDDNSENSFDPSVWVYTIGKKCTNNAQHKEEDYDPLFVGFEPISQEHLNQLRQQHNQQQRQSRKQRLIGKLLIFSKKQTTSPTIMCSLKF